MEHMVRMNFQVDSPAAWAAEYHNCTLLDRNISVEKTLFESADATCQLLRSCSKETLPKLCESIRENGLGGRKVWLDATKRENVPALLPPQGVLKVLTCLKDVGHDLCTMPRAWRHDSTGIVHLQKHSAKVPVKFLVAQLEAMEETKGLAWLRAMSITSESQCAQSKDGPALFDQELAKTAWEVGQITALPKVLRILGSWKLGMPQILLDALMASHRLELMQLRELTRPSLIDTFSDVKALNAALDDASELCKSILALNLAENLENLTMNCFRCNDFAKVPSAKDWNDLSSQVAKIQHLSLEHFSVADLGIVVHQAKSLKSLSFPNNQLTELPKEVFRGLSNLTSLNLEDNKLTELPKEVFSGLSNLETLDLAGNKLTELPKEVFSGLSNLETLNLGSNKLTELPKEVFRGLSNLETLNLGSNKLTELPKEVFRGLSNLTSLYLNGNKLTELPKEVFSGLSNLKVLVLLGNQLTELPNKVISGLSNLKDLYLHNNQLTELSKEVFSGLSHLKVLSLGYNKLTELPKEVFRGLSNLTSLDLGYNKLTELPKEVFRGLSNLTSLDLRYNKLTEDDIPGFSNLTARGVGIHF